MTKTDVERAVRDRYSSAAGEKISELCCPVDYDDRYLAVIPREIIERDYGCGNPSRYLRSGETVLDLGSGAGKICYIASQIVGPHGAVIGIDANDEMLNLAQSHRAAVAKRLGYSNVRFLKASIQDLSPVVSDSTVDVVVSNCVLNLVAHDDRPSLFREIHRVLSDDGRAVISDIASDRDVPVAMQADPELWSGCLAGAFREDRLLEAFRTAGFRGTRLIARGDRPWRVVDGVEFRSVTVEAFKGGAAGGGPNAGR